VYKKDIEKFKLTLAGLALASVVYFITIILKVDLFETMIESFETFEAYELDEIVIPVFILFIFAFFDLLRRQGLQRIESGKNKIYMAMLASTHHILNNFLNQVQLFRITAENTPGFDPRVLSLYKVVIQDASTQIEALSSITSIDEASINEAVAPKLTSQPGTQQSAAAEAKIPCSRLFTVSHKTIDVSLSN